MNSMLRRTAAAVLGVGLALIPVRPVLAGLDVKTPEGWTRVDASEGDLAFSPPGGTAFRDAAVFDADLVLSPNVDALKPLALAVFPQEAKAGEMHGRTFTLDGYAATEIWGGATLGKTHLVQATLFVWKGTRMIPVAVLANGDDAAPAREMAARIARSAKVEKTETFFPVPGAPQGVVAPANWTPKTLEGAAFTARVSAPDAPGSGAPGMIRYEFRPGGFDRSLDRLLDGLDRIARSRGAERIRTTGVDTRAAGRSVTVYQQAVDERVLLTGAVIHYPSGALQVTYFDRPDRAKARKAMFDQLIDALAAADLAAPAEPPRPGPAASGGGAKAGPSTGGGSGESGSP